jgi:pSer/pThr/pTyr-binding forkhead associated (FHA) protein
MNDPNRTQLGAPPVLDPNKTMMGMAPSLNATQIIKPTQCPICKTFNPAGMMFCIDCGLIFDRSLPDDAFGAPAVQLPVLIGPGGKEFPLRVGDTIFGRQGDVVIDDARVSRQHAAVSNTNGQITVRDLGSTNGTKLAGASIGPAPMPVSEGQVVSLGGVEFVLSHPGAANATLMPSGGKTAAIPAMPRAKASWKLVSDDLTLDLPEGVHTLGRRSENALCVPDAHVSGKHASVEVTASEVFITDTGSTNGTFVNDVKLMANARTAVHEGDKVRVGDVIFHLHVAG